MSIIRSFEPMLRDATVKALDNVGQRFAGVEVTKDNAITRLLNQWNGLAPEEKENVATVIIATTITAVSAIAALKGSRKKLAKKVVKKVAKKVTR